MQKTSAGIFIDDLQKFAGFEAAMKLVIKSSKSPRRSNIPVLSRQIREVLVSLGSAMMKVVSCDFRFSHVKNLTSVLQGEIDKTYLGSLNIFNDLRFNG